ncbi:hypothetical protein Dimus_013724 [Dionaea muscipula]
MMHQLSVRLPGGRLTKDVEEETLMSMGIHVLVVDCHITSLIATSRVLRESKYKVVATTNANSALKHLARRKGQSPTSLLPSRRGRGRGGRARGRHRS